MTGIKIQPLMKHGYETERIGSTNETLIQTNCVECREARSRLAKSFGNSRGLVFHERSASSSLRFTFRKTNDSNLRAPQRISVANTAVRCSMYLPTNGLIHRLRRFV